LARTGGSQFIKPSQSPDTLSFPRTSPWSVNATAYLPDSSSHLG
jgi:hypothetical protein